MAYVHATEDATIWFKSFRGVDSDGCQDMEIEYVWLHFVAFVPLDKRLILARPSTPCGNIHTLERRWAAQTLAKEFVGNHIDVAIGHRDVTDKRRTMDAEFEARRRERDVTGVAGIFRSLTP